MFLLNLITMRISRKSFCAAVLPAYTLVLNNHIFFYVYFFVTGYNCKYQLLQFIDTEISKYDNDSVVIIDLFIETILLFCLLHHLDTFIQLSDFGSMINLNSKLSLSTVWTLWGASSLTSILYIVW